jgi:hypothetical protein
MKVKEYIKLHPRTFLAKELAEEDPKTKIIVGKGIVSTHFKSKMGQAIIKAGKKYKDYKVGGRAGRFSSEGNHWAILLK